MIRAVGPLDSILQAAGRCNREGSRPEGTVVVVEPADGGLPPGDYRVATSKTRTLIAAGTIDPDDPATATGYFRALLVPPFTDTDRRRIQALRDRLSFGDVDREFRMIDEETESVIVDYPVAEYAGRGPELAERLRRRDGPPRELLRSLQPYLVAIPRYQADRERRLIEEIRPGLGVWLGDYDDTVGLILDLRPEGLVG